MNPKGALLATVMLMGGILTARALREGTLSPRTYAGLAIMAVMLFGVSAFSPELATAFGVLALVAMLLGSDDVQNLVQLLSVKGVRSGR